MADRERVLLSALAGAAIGAAAGFLMLTNRGRTVRGQIEPKLDEFLGNVDQLKASVRKARQVAEASWHSFQQIIDETTPRPSTRPEPAEGPEPQGHPEPVEGRKPTSSGRPEFTEGRGRFDQRWETGTRPH
ncbi:MAG: hypothetical protein GEU99_16620 [Luteitalea sp.]|nr:hypothetical protein [Luteitalea sp.]